MRQVHRGEAEVYLPFLRAVGEGGKLMCIDVSIVVGGQVGCLTMWLPR